MKKVISMTVLVSAIACISGCSSQHRSTAHPTEKKAISYRMEGKQKMQILDTVGFFLYKTTGFERTGKGALMPVTSYCFSVDSTSAVYPLRIASLKKAFPARTSFHYRLDAYFRSDADLIRYDPYIHMYKLKYLFTSRSI